MQNKFRIKIGLIILSIMAAALLLSGCCGDSNKTAGADKTGGDAQFFVSTLLGVEDPQFLSKDSDGTEQVDELKIQQKWGELYNKYKKQAETGDETGFKYYLFIGFMADLQHNAELSEAYSSDLIPIYEKDPMTFLVILRELPYLIESSGYYMNNYFGFEDKNAEKKPDFLKNNKQFILNILGAEDGARLLSKFD